MKDRKKKSPALKTKKLTKHQVKIEQKGRHRSLVERLRFPIDPHYAVIHADNAISNQGLRKLADKLEAIGEALAYLIEKKHMKIRTKRRGG